MISFIVNYGGLGSFYVVGLVHKARTRGVLKVSGATGYFRKKYPTQACFAGPLSVSSAVVLVPAFYRGRYGIYSWAPFNDNYYYDDDDETLHIINLV